MPYTGARLLIQYLSRMFATTRTIFFDGALGMIEGLNTRAVVLQMLRIECDKHEPSCFCVR